MLSSSSRWQKAIVPISLSESGKETLLILVPVLSSVFEKQSAAILVIPSGTTTFSSVQSSASTSVLPKMKYPSSFTCIFLHGVSIKVNADICILSKLSGSFTSVSEVQPEKTKSSICFIVSGIFTDLILVISLNVNHNISVTGSPFTSDGITRSTMSLLLHSQSLASVSEIS